MGESQSFRGSEAPKSTAAEAVALYGDEAKRIIGAAEGQHKTLFWIAAETGLRAGELAGLRIENLELDDQLIRVSNSIYAGQLQEPKSQNAKRKIPISPKLTEHIKSYLKVWKANEMNLLFLSYTGKPLDPGNVRRCNLAPICKKLGLKTKGLNAFRHCHASMMDQAGTPLKVRQERLGHAPGSPVTMVHYTHSISADHRSAAEAVGGMLS